MNLYLIHILYIWYIDMTIWWVLLSIKVVYREYIQFSPYFRFILKLNQSWTWLNSNPRRYADNVLESENIFDYFELESLRIEIDQSCSGLNKGFWLDSSSISKKNQHCYHGATVAKKRIYLWKMFRSSDDRFNVQTNPRSAQGLRIEARAPKIACKYYEDVLVRFFTRPNLHTYKKV